METTKYRALLGLYWADIGMMEQNRELLFTI